MAWRVSHGALNGVPLDGLSIVAVVAGDRNLGITRARWRLADRREVGDHGRQSRKAGPAAGAAGDGQGVGTHLVTDVVELKPVSIAFTKDSESFTVSAGSASLDVARKVEHSPVCGAVQWFQPLAQTDENEMA